MYGAHAKQVVEDSAKGKATINVTPTFLCNEIKFDTIKPLPASYDRRNSEQELDSGTSQPQSSSMESEHKQDNRKLQRNLSTGSRRKVRLRRMGSRQNSKTEESASSEDEAMNYVLEASKKVKRKTSKCKNKEAEKALEVAPSDDVVYIVKLKPTLSSETEVTYNVKTTTTTEGHIELSNETGESIPSPLTASMLIKTKRKMFSPIDQFTSGEVSTATGFELESPTKDATLVNPDSTRTEMEHVETHVPFKPPLPQSPRLQDRRNLNGNKDMAPNIRLMIAKYNNKISTDTNSPAGSGSCSPVAWRSPVLDRRVKLQTAKYQEQVGILSKSSSTGSVKKLEESPLASRKVQKSHSSKECFLIQQESYESALLELPEKNKENSSSSKELESETFFDAKETFDDYYDTVLSYDTLKKKLMKNLEKQKTVCDDISKLADDVERSWLEQKHKDSSKGAIRKITKVGMDNLSYLRSMSLADEKSVNTPPKIFRKHDQSRPLLQTSISVSPDVLYGDRKPPKSPLSHRAEKLRKAKEEFLKTEPISIRISEKQIDPNNRLSQISTMTCSSVDDSYLMRDSSVSNAKLSETCSIDTSGGPIYSMHGSESGDNRSVSETTGSRFNLSSLASKLRKVKLRKNSKELPHKMSAISTLCRQSLMADITGESVKADITSASSKSSLTDSGKVKKSESLHIFSRFFRPSKEKLKKSRSLGLLEQIDTKRKHSK